MLFVVLGQVEVVHGAGPLPLGAPKQRCVLAALLLEPRQVLRADRLCDMIWGEDPPATARKSLQVYVSNLRRVLEPVPGVAIESHQDGYSIDVDPDQVDLHRFRRLVAEASTVDGAGARTLLHDALALWRGPVLSGIGDGELRERYAPALHEECLRAYEQRIAADLDAGQATELVPELLVEVGENPLRETAHVLLMKALYRAGRLGEALGVFRDLRRRTVDELGSEPGPEAFAVHQQLLEAQDADAEGESRAPEQAGPAAHPPTVPAQLPPAVSGFAGRDTEVARIAAVLTGPADGVPVVGVTGPGGVGKSALALRVAHQLRGQFGDGQLYADLRGSRDAPAEPADVLAAFLRALGVDADRMPATVDDRSGLYRTLLDGRRVLVVLDDAAGAEQVRPLLPGESRCGVLVTARNRLLVLEGSHPVELDELAADEAHRMLAAAVGAERVAAEPAAAAAIVDACGRLPLALRIAAGRLAAHPAAGLAEFADRLSSARVLDELAVGDVGVRNTLALSYQQLAPDVARAFRLLAVPEVASVSLPTVAAALDVSHDEARRLTGVLVDLHLLTASATGRYRYHDLLRVYARERSAAGADTPDDRARTVRRTFQHLAESATAALRATIPTLTLADLQLDGAVAAREFADHAAAEHWLEHEHVNLTTVSSQMLGLPDLPLYAMAQLTNHLGNYAEAAGYWPGWQELGTRLLDRTVTDGDGPAEMLTRMCVGGFALRHGEPVVAVEQLTPFVDHCRAAGEHTRLGRGLTMLALAHQANGDQDDAFRCFDEALDAHRRGGNRRSYALTASSLAEHFTNNGAYDQAVAHASTAREIWHELGAGDPYLGVDVHKNLGFACAALGRYAEAVEHCATALRIGDATGYTQARRPLVAALARAHRDAGQLAPAAGYFEQALGTPDDPREPPTAATAEPTLRRELGEVLARMGRIEHAEATGRAGA